MRWKEILLRKEKKLNIFDKINFLFISGFSLPIKYLYEKVRWLLGFSKKGIGKCNPLISLATGWENVQVHGRKKIVREMKETEFYHIVWNIVNLEEREGVLKKHYINQEELSNNKNTPYYKKQELYEWHSKSNCLVLRASFSIFISILKTVLIDYNAFTKCYITLYWITMYLAINNFKLSLKVLY